MENQELNFYEKLNKIQTLLKAPKEQVNNFGKYKYRSIEDILESIKPLLETYKLVLLISDEVVSIGERIYIKATAKVINTTDDKCLESIGYAREATHKKGMDESQITGAASTYARKSSLAALFCLDNSKDADATNDHKENNIIDVIRKTKDETKFKTLEDTINNLNDKEKECEFQNDNSITINNNNLQEDEKILWISKTVDPDVYNLYLRETLLNEKSIGIANVSSLETSKMLRLAFKNKNASTLIKFICKFNQQFKKWKPLYITN